MFETKRNKIIAAIAALVIIIITVVTIVIINGNRQKDIDTGKTIIDRYYESYEKTEDREAKAKVYNDLYKDQEVKDYIEKFNEVKEYLTATETKIQDSSKKYFKDKFNSIEKVTIEEKDVSKINSFNESINNLIKMVEDDKIVSKENKGVLIEEFKASLINMDEFYKKKNEEYELSYNSIINDIKDEAEAVNKMNELLDSIKDIEEFKDIRTKISNYIDEHEKKTSNESSNESGSGSRSNSNNNSNRNNNSNNGNNSSPSSHNNNNTNSSQSNKSKTIVINTNIKEDSGLRCDVIGDGRQWIIPKTYLTYKNKGYDVRISDGGSFGEEAVSINVYDLNNNAAYFRFRQDGTIWQIRKDPNFID